MPIRVVRFTDVTPERMDEIESRVSEADSPPEDAPVKSVKLLVDRDQGTAIVIQHYETVEDMKAGDQALNAMDASRTPGTRASVDMCEVAAKRDFS